MSESVLQLHQLNVSQSRGQFKRFRETMEEKKKVVKNTEYREDGRDGILQKLPFSSLMIHPYNLSIEAFAPHDLQSPITPDNTGKETRKERKGQRKNAGKGKKKVIIIIIFIIIKKKKHTHTPCGPTGQGGKLQN